MPAKELEKLLRNKEWTRWGGGYFEFNEPKASSGTEQKVINHAEENKNKPEPVSSIEESDVAKSLSIFPIVDLEDFDITEKMVDFFQVNNVIEKLKMKKAEAEKNGKSWVQLHD